MKYCRLVARLKGTMDLLVSKWYDLAVLDIELICKFYNGLMNIPGVYEVNIEYSNEGK